MDSDWHDFLREVHRLAEFAPPILSPIEADWDARGWHKKLLREAARRFFAERTPDLRHLPNLTPPPRAVTPPKPALAGGRPGLAPSVVLLFLMRRGRAGGRKEQTARLLLEASMTLPCWLEKLGRPLSAASTLSDHLNAVSNATHACIHRTQLRSILAEGLDDFTSLYLDGTATAAHPEWPTDSGLRTKLVARIGRAGSQVARFGLPNFPPAGQSEWQKDRRGMPRESGFAAGQPKRQGQLKKRHHQRLRRGQRAAKRSPRALAAAKRALDATTQLTSSERSLATALRAQIGEALRASGQVAATCRHRVFAGETVPSAEKLVRPSAGDAAFIVKGGGGHATRLPPPTGPKRAGLRQRAARAAGQRGRPRPTYPRRAGPLGAHGRAAQLGGCRRRLQPPQRAGRFTAPRRGRGEPQRVQGQTNDPGGRLAPTGVPGGARAPCGRGSADLHAQRRLPIRATTATREPERASRTEGKDPGLQL